jgi:hypothetical protein
MGKTVGHRALRSCSKTSGSDVPAAIDDAFLGFVVGVPDETPIDVLAPNDRRSRHRQLHVHSPAVLAT